MGRHLIDFSEHTTEEKSPDNMAKRPNRFNKGGHLSPETEHGSVLCLWSHAQDWKDCGYFIVIGRPLDHHSRSLHAAATASTAAAADDTLGTSPYTVVFSAAAIKAFILAVRVSFIVAASGSRRA